MIKFCSFHLYKTKILHKSISRIGKRIAQAPMVNPGSGAPDQHFYVQIIKSIFQILAQNLQNWLSIVSSLLLIKIHQHLLGLVAVKTLTEKFYLYRLPFPSQL